LQRGVDRNQAVDAADDFGIVGVIGGVHVEDRIAVRELVKVPRSDQLAGNNAALIHHLVSIGDDAGAHELDDTVGEAAAVYAEVLVSAQRTPHGLGNGTDADLKI